MTENFWVRYRLGFWLPWVVFGLITGTYIYLSINSIESFEFQYEGDGGVFERIARQSIFSLNFWAADRPWAVPLVYKLVGNEKQTIIYSQFFCLWLGHGFLAWVLFTRLKKGIWGVLATVFVYLYALGPIINGFALVIRTESITFALTAATIGVMILMIEKFRDSQVSPWKLWSTLIFTYLLLLLLASARENWGLLLLVVPGYSLAPLLVPSWRRSMGTHILCARVALALLCVLTFFVNQAAVKNGERWRFPIQNVIFHRILNDPQATTIMTEQFEMPIDNTVRQMKGKNASWKNRMIYDHEEFQGWLMDRGMDSYIAYTIQEHEAQSNFIWKTMKKHIDDLPYWYFDKMGKKTAIARWSKDNLYNNISHRVEMTMLLLIVVSLAIGAGVRSPIGSIALSFSLFAITLPFQTAYIFLGDAIEHGRHYLSVSITLRILSGLLIVITLAALAQAIQNGIKIHRSSSVNKENNTK